jgi:hypothetical protein
VVVVYSLWLYFLRIRREKEEKGALLPTKTTTTTTTTLPCPTAIKGVVGSSCDGCILISLVLFCS